MTNTNYKTKDYTFYYWQRAIDKTLKEIIQRCQLFHNVIILNKPRVNEYGSDNDLTFLGVTSFSCLLSFLKLMLSILESLEEKILENEDTHRN